MGIVEVPLFPGVELQQWISWMENYFDRKGLTDFEKLHMAYGFIVGEAERYINGIDSLMPIRNWKHMKETLLWKFGAEDDPERIKLQNEERRYREQWLKRFQNTEEEILKETTTKPSADLIQVYKTNSEDSEKDSQLGYRGIENRDGLLMNVDKHEDLPVFDGEDPESWIVKADRYYRLQSDDYKLGMIFLNLSGDVRSWLGGMLRRKKIKDWADFKQQLLARYDPVMSCSALDVKNESTSLDEGVHETEGEKHSTTVEEVSFTSVAETEVHQQDLVCEIVPETVMVEQTVSCGGVQQKELNHATVQETNMLIKKESLAATDQEMELHCETGHVPSYLAVETYQRADLTVSSDVVLEAAMVEKTASQSSITVSHLETNGVQQQQAEYYFYVNRPDYYSIDVVLETGLVQETHSAILQSHDTHQTFSQRHVSRRLSCKKKKGKYPKAWKYKFKSRNFQRVMLRRLVNVKPFSESEFLVEVTGKKKHWLLELSGVNRKGFLRSQLNYWFDFLGKQKLVKWSQVVSVFCWLGVSGAITTSVKRKHYKNWWFKYKVKTLTITMFLSSWAVGRVTLVRYDCTNQSILLSQLKSSVSYNGDWLRPAIEDDKNLVWCLQLPCVLILNARVRSWCRIMRQHENKEVEGVFRGGNYSVLSGCTSLPSRTLEEPKLLRRILRSKGFQALKQFLFGDGMFQVKHRWRVKKLKFVSGSYFLSSSLWASLFSRAGVYESILICLWIVAVLIWRYDGEQKEKTEPVMQELFPTRVSSCLNHLLPQENDMLLMHHEGKLLRVRVQQSHKKKRPLKTYMFKYKQLLSKIGAWPEIQQLNVHRAYVDAENRRGYKVKQQRRRSKMSKSWMFKYKERENSAATLAIAGAIRPSRMQYCYHDLFLMLQKLLFFSKLVGKLVFVGKVLIDFYYLETDVAG